MSYRCPQCSETANGWYHERRDRRYFCQVCTEAYSGQPAPKPAKPRPVPIPAPSTEPVTLDPDGVIRRGMYR